ncbi:MAG: 50S ribosomal protein L25/general stress protein Ctc [Anaerolineae bacterium]|nr:MAG: 50S ribosomal protein L25/general stress protein Ctc [Anaerolineae bacterium]
MDTPKLKGQKRTLIGKRVKTLRRIGRLPGVLYGAGIESVPIELDGREASRLLSRASGSTLIELDLDDESHAVLVRGVQRDVIRGDYLHVDFLKVAMDVRIRAEVPIELIGEPPAAEEAGVVLLTGVTTVEVEALPADLPDRITVNLEILESLEDSITVADLFLGQEITVLTELDELIARPIYQAEEIIEEIVEEEELEELLEGEEVEEVGEGEAEADSEAEAKSEKDS